MCAWSALTGCTPPAGRGGPPGKDVSPNTTQNK
jgi:hypothetical protein